MLSDGNLRLEKLQGGDVRTDGRSDGRTYGRTYGNSPLCPTGHRPFGAAAQKGRNFQTIDAIVLKFEILADVMPLDVQAKNLDYEPS